MDFKLLSQDHLYQGKVFNLRQDTLEFEDGRRFQVDVVEHGGAVVIIPLEQDQSIWFVRQYRHPVGRVLLELPAGGINPGEISQQAAERECREEVGLAPETVSLLGQTFLAPGYSSERLEYYLATDLHPSPLPQDEDEDLETARIPYKHAMEMLQAGEFLDAKTIVGLTLTSLWLEKQA